jgi:hypothetical protein
VPTDDEVFAQFAPFDDVQWDLLWVAAEALRADPTPFHWRNILPGSRNLPYVEFGEIFEATFTLMIRVGLLIRDQEFRPFLPARTWDDQVAAIGRYSLIECARFFTYNSRRDRIIEGMVATCVEEGLWMMTLDRARELVNPTWTLPRL